jgi:type III secretion protein K
MSAAATHPTPLNHALGEAWLRFNLLPSMTLHPSRCAEWAFATSMGENLQALHRHWSAALARSLALDPVLDLSDPALPLAMLPEPAFHKVQLWCGIAQMAPAIRRVVAREQLAVLTQQLGSDGVAFAQHHTPAIGVRKDAGMGAGMPATPPLQPVEAAANCARWGAGLLSLAFSAAAQPVASRAQLRLPADVAQSAALVNAAGFDAATALSLALVIVELTDPAWLSSFPAAR